MEKGQQMSNKENEGARIILAYRKNNFKAII